MTFMLAVELLPRTRYTRQWLLLNSSRCLLASEYLGLLPVANHYCFYGMSVDFGCVAYLRRPL